MSQHGGLGSTRDDARDDPFIFKQQREPIIGSDETAVLSASYGGNAEGPRQGPAVRPQLRELSSKESFGFIPPVLISYDSREDDDRTSGSSTKSGYFGSGDRVATIDEEYGRDDAVFRESDDNFRSNPESDLRDMHPLRRAPIQVVDEPVRHPSRIGASRWDMRAGNSAILQASARNGAHRDEHSVSEEGSYTDEDRDVNNSGQSKRYHASPSETASVGSESSQKYSSSFTVSFSSEGSRHENFRPNATVQNLTSIDTASLSSGSFADDSTKVKEGPRSEREGRNQTAPELSSTALSIQPPAPVAIASSSRGKKSVSGNLHFTPPLQSLPEDSNQWPSAPTAAMNAATSRLKVPSPSRSPLQKPHSGTGPSAPAVPPPSAKSLSRWSRLPMLLPNSLKKLGSSVRKETHIDEEVDMTTPSAGITTKRSMSAGGILNRGSSSANPLLRRLMPGKDKSKDKPSTAGTSIPVSVANKLKGAKTNSSKAGVTSSSSAGVISSSSKTLLAGSSGTIWDDEDIARATTSHETEAEYLLAAKMRFEARYKVVKHLGAGGHSTVRLAIRQTDQTQVVLKYIRNSSVWHWQATGTRRYPLEVHLMRKLTTERNDHIIKYFEHFELNGRYVIVMEYLGEDWVDLYDYIEMFGPVKESISVEIFGQVVDTVLYLYNMGYHHNDIKDENILIQSKTRFIKLIDFGSATAVNPGATCELFYGTKKFAAPEAVRGDPYRPDAQEVWALGTLLFVLLFKLDPFTTDEEIMGTDIGRRIARYRAVSHSKSSSSSASSSNGGMLDISDEAIKSLKMMMEKDWARRVPITDIRKLPIFTKHRTWEMD